MALPQVVTKTYSRRRQSQHSDVSHAERTFDEVFRGDSRPPARAAATAEKWGTASFKRISNSTRSLPKRRVSPGIDTNDPFSFDSDDDSSAKRSKNVTSVSSRGTECVTNTAGRGEVNGTDKCCTASDGCVDKSNKMTRCRRTAAAAAAVKSGLPDCCVVITGKGDCFQQQTVNSCQSNGVNTRAIDACRTTEQLKVFVNNFSQLLSTASRHSQSQPVADLSSHQLSSSSCSSERDSPAAKRSKTLDNCRRWRRSDVCDTGVKRAVGPAAGDSDSVVQVDNDDDAEVVVLKQTTVRSVGSSHRTRNRSLYSVSRSGTLSVLLASCDLDRSNQLLQRQRMLTTDDNNGSTSTATTATAATTRRLLTGSHKTTMRRTKAVYNPRQWNDAEDLGSSQLSSASSCVSMAMPLSTYDDLDIDLEHTPPVSVSGSHLNTSSSQSSAGSAKVTVNRDQKMLYTVVRNVKEAHECQEYGETQEFCDDIEYILDGLSDVQPVPTRCLSAVNLVSKCSTSAFRMHLRAHDTFMKMLSALHDAPHDARLALCTSTVMYMMSRDHLVMHIDAASLELMLRLLSLDAAPQSIRSDDDFSRIRQRLYDIVQQTGPQTSLSLDDMTPGQLVMETLLSLTSKQAGEWFKDTLRTLSGLDQLVGTVTRCVETLCSCRLSAVTMTEQLHHVERCIRVLERVTYLNTDNQNYLLSSGCVRLIRSVHRLMKLCVRRLPTCVCGEADSRENVSTSVVSACLLTSLRLLFNVTHDNNRACDDIGGHDGLLETVLTCTLLSPQYVSPVSRFELIILGVGLLTNLVENCDMNRQRLIQVKCVPPYDCHYTQTTDTVDSVEALGMLFSVRYEAAKLIEEEQDAEIEEVERRKALMTLLPDTMTLQSCRSTGGGGWQESDSGMFWEPGDTSVLDSSADGLAAMHAARQQAAALAASNTSNPASQLQDDDENYTKVLHTAGRHMEDSIMAAYIALLIGTLIQHKQDLAEHVRETLPSFSFRPMVQTLSKFLGFMNLTNASGTSASKSIQRVIETLDAC